MKYALLALALTLSACTLPPPPEIPSVAMTPVSVQPLAFQPVLEPTVVFVPSPVECLEVVSLTTLVEPQAPAKVLKRGKPLTPRLEKVSTPAEIVATAQLDARRYPDKAGYFGKTAEYTYIWQAGRVDTIYLTPKFQTGIFLPPGEEIAIGLYLDPKVYAVQNDLVGAEPFAYSALGIQPLTDKDELEAFIVTKSGKRLLLHLVVGATDAKGQPIGMQAVRYELPSLHHASDERPALVLPKPQP